LGATLKVLQKITSYKVLTDEQQQPAPPPPEKMHEKLERPEILQGSTYKIKSPQNEHALYITINDMVLNMGTEHEQLHPYEIFINSKNMEHFQWVLALTRTVSAVWRKGGDCAFLVEELKAVFDPQGGYWKKGGVFMPSLVAEIGSVIEDHLKRIGVIKTEIDEYQKQFLETKRKEFEAKQETESTGFPANATMCGKCHTKAVVMMDGCQVCLQCSDSKCG
jgi:cytochrome c553